MTRRLMSLMLAVPVLVAACGKPAPIAQAPAPAAAPPPDAAPAPDPDAERRAREAEAARRAAEEARLRAELTERIHFDFDQATLRPEARAALDRKIAILAKQRDLQLRIDGHADDRGSDEYNLALGMRRAMAAKQYVSGRGIDAGRLTVMSHGEELPLDRGRNELAWALNRRDEFTIIAGSVIAVR